MGFDIRKFVLFRLDFGLSGLGVFLSSARSIFTRLFWVVLGGFDELNVCAI